jgi:hypothetical protein
VEVQAASSHFRHELLLGPAEFPASLPRKTAEFEIEAAGLLPLVERLLYLASQLRVTSQVAADLPSADAEAEPVVDPAASVLARDESPSPKRLQCLRPKPQSGKG